MSGALIHNEKTTLGKFFLKTNIFWSNTCHHFALSSFDNKQDGQSNNHLYFDISVII